MTNAQMMIAETKVTTGLISILKTRKIVKFNERHSFRYFLSSVGFFESVLDILVQPYYHICGWSLLRLNSDWSKIEARLHCVPYYSFLNLFTTQLPAKNIPNVNYYRISPSQRYKLSSCFSTFIHPEQKEKQYLVTTFCSHTFYRSNFVLSIVCIH